ncbi:hypothetical protein LTR93_005494 [Exophiala xenobiotica]|nr:hypothetical protein LTS06_004037 [Exophiala xenobiotica]KAK5323440.1 hypothetical protein LTR93_005494 [Exophiala xenobiotica]KAK5350765.1 hypothetical protein LTR61_005963 [Exophiala xenobiotica]
MADSGRITGERVFCHQCENEWDRAQGGLTCPRCEGDFTEILDSEPESDRDLRHGPPSMTPSPPPSPPLQPLFDHNPWADDLDPDPRNNFTTFEFASNNGGGRISFSTRTLRTGGMAPMNVMDTLDEDTAHDFDNMLTELLSPQARGMPPPFGNLNPFGFAGAGAAFTRNPHAPVQPGNLQDLFGLILQSMQPPTMTRGEMDDRRGQDLPPHPFDLLNQLFNPGNAQHGDMVFSQEAFDRVMSQLMEQNNGSNAPPPASEDAIQSLEKKKVDKEMLGTEGKAECSICMDNVDLGDEVTVLPCNHWFHGDCVTAWLKEHDTCPHCRSPITNSNQPQQPGSSRRRPSRRASSVSSPRAFGLEGSRYNPVTIPESPSDLRQARQSYYGRRDADTERSMPVRHSSGQSGPRRHSTRTGSGGSGDSRNQNTGGGGVTGWIRDHLPFS